MVRPDMQPLLDALSETTPGPWEPRQSSTLGTSVEAPSAVAVAWCGTNSSHGNIAHYRIRTREAKANARFVALAHGLVPAMAEYIEHLEAGLRLAHRDIEILEAERCEIGK